MVTFPTVEKNCLPNPFGGAALKPKVLIIVCLWFLVFLAGNGVLGLMETSEARYAEISREMVATGDWLSPHLNGAPHFTKPPLNYWGMAVSMTLFGSNPWAARLWPTLCSALGLLFLFSFLNHEKDLGGKTAIALGATLLFGLLARVPTTDPVVFCLDMGIFLSYWKWRRGEKVNLMVLLMAFLGAVAFLNKGPAGILVPLLVIPAHLLVCRPTGGGKTKLTTWLFAPILFLGVLAPWFALVWKKHPGLFHYMVTKEAAGGAVDASRFHGGDLFYYLPILLVGLSPWAVLALRGRWRDTSPMIRFLWIWAVVPLLVFSLFPAKLPTYILPVLPAWVALGLHFGLNKEGPRKSLLWCAMGFAGLMTAAFAAAPFALEVTLPALGTGIFFMAAFLCLSWLVIWLRALSQGKRLLWWAPLPATFFLTAMLPWALVQVEHDLKFPRRAVQAILADPDAGAPCLLLYTSAASLPFQLERPVASLGAFHTHRKWTPEKMPANFLQNEEDVKDWLYHAGEAFVLFDSRRKAPNKMDLITLFNDWFPHRQEVWSEGRYRVYKVFAEPGPVLNEGEKIHE